MGTGQGLRGTGGFGTPCHGVTWKMIFKYFYKLGSCPSICHLTPREVRERLKVKLFIRKRTVKYEPFSSFFPIVPGFQTRPPTPEPPYPSENPTEVGTESLTEMACNHKSGTAHHRAQKRSMKSSWHGLLCLFLVALASRVMQDKI